MASLLKHAETRHLAADASARSPLSDCAEVRSTHRRGALRTPPGLLSVLSSFGEKPLRYGHDEAGMDGTTFQQFSQFFEGGLAAAYFVNIGRDDLLGLFRG